MATMWHDMAPSARRARGLGVLRPQARLGCAHCTPDSILTKCTVLSHCSRTLFISTVHEIFKKKLNKIKLNNFFLLNMI